METTVRYFLNLDDVTLAACRWLNRETADFTNQLYFNYFETDVISKTERLNRFNKTY